MFILKRCILIIEKVHFWSKKQLQMIKDLF